MRHAVEFLCQGTQRRRDIDAIRHWGRVQAAQRRGQLCELQCRARTRDGQRLGHGFGRLGCFSAGCCYGSACSTPWAVTFKNSYAHELTGIPLNTPIHPVQLYEAVLNFLNFVVLFLILRKKRWDGQVFSFYIINYSVIRFFTEYFRGDHPDRSYFIRGASNLASLSYSQLFCIAGLIVGVALLFILQRRKSA